MRGETTGQHNASFVQLRRMAAKRAKTSSSRSNGKASTILAGGLRFASAQELLDFLPSDERALMERLREFVISEAPQLHERLSFNILAYKQRRDICFLWPASVLWGGKKTYEGVRFGFSHADLLEDPSGYLERGNRKQVYWRDLQEFTRTDERMLSQLLAQAVARDQEHRSGLR